MTITLLVGPAGSGKIGMARLMAGECQNFRYTYTDREHIYQVAGLGAASLTESPFSAPHHTASMAALLGTMQGGWRWQPGECSLAHGGTLLLDEVPEFRRVALDAIHGAYEEGFLRLSQRAPKRAGLSEGLSPYVVPCKFDIIATMAACPCGKRSVDSSPDECRCDAEQIAAYHERVPAWIRAGKTLHVMNGKVTRMDTAAGRVLEGFKGNRKY